MASKMSTNEGETLRVEHVNWDAITPKRATPLSAGLDLFSPKEVAIRPHQRIKIPLDLVFHFPPGSYGRISERSGLAFYKGIRVLGGVIDADFKGNVCVILHNSGNEEHHIKKGDRIAQLLIERMVHPLNIVEVSAGYSASDGSVQRDERIISDDESIKKVRGRGGLGSTGM